VLARLALDFPHQTSAAERTRFLLVTPSVQATRATIAAARATSTHGGATSAPAHGSLPARRLATACPHREQSRRRAVRWAGCGAEHD
jgi:hypothetical protein